MSRSGGLAGQLIILPDPPTLATHVADWLVTHVRKGKLRIALSGGSTPKAMFDQLATRSVDWSQAELFWGDERFVPADHPDSNYAMTKNHLLSKVNIQAAHIHPIPTDSTPADSASQYEKVLQSIYGSAQLDPTRRLFDITFLGLGEDGHTASLLPGEPVLNERTRWVAEVAHGRPETRITLTYPPLESSGVVAFLVTGAAKRDILARARAGDTALPAGRLRPQGELIWFVDRAAAGES